MDGFVVVIIYLNLPFCPLNKIHSKLDDGKRREKRRRREKGGGGAGRAGEEGRPPCVFGQPIGVGCHQKLDLKLYCVQLLVLFPDPGTLIIFPFSKHRDYAYFTGLLEVRGPKEEMHVESFLKSKVLQEHKAFKVV